MTGIDRDHVVAALRQVFEGEIARPHIDRRGPHHRDRLHAVENRSDVVVVVGVVVHLNIQSRPGAVIASAAKQSIVPQEERMDCFVAALLAMTEATYPAISARASR